MHEIQIVVGNRATLQPLRRVLGTPVFARFYGQLAALPIPASSVAKASGSDAFNWPDLDCIPEVSSMSEALCPFIAIVRRSRPSGDLALILTQYWGGSGTQAALQFHDGDVVWGPAVGDGTVNEVLRRLGVMSCAGKDEWDTVGLESWRTTEDLAGLASS